VEANEEDCAVVEAGATFGVWFQGWACSNSFHRGSQDDPSGSSTHAHHFFRSSVSTTRGYTRTVPQKIKASQIPSHGNRMQEDEISRLNIERILSAPTSFIVDPCACIDPPGSCLALARSPDGTNLKNDHGETQGSVAAQLFRSTNHA
jgi:hypothetical protein